MRKLVGLLAALLLLVASVGATITLSGTWLGQPIIHRVERIEAVVDGVPSVAERYYFTADGLSKTADDAIVVSDINATGSLDYYELEKVGDCTFEAIITNNGDYTIVTSDYLDGTPVSKGNVMKWSLKPNSASVTDCKLVFDLNLTT